VDSRAFRVLRVTQATAAPRDLAEVVPQGHRAHRVFKVLRASVARQVLVLVVPQAPWGPKVSVVRWASRAPREIQAHRVLKASLAAMA